MKPVIAPGNRTIETNAANRLRGRGNSMQINELAALLEADILAEGRDAEVTCGYSCDLLSLVMSRGRPGMAWVTVQTHLNVIAVASLGEMACVILPERFTMEPLILAKAREEGIAVLSSPKTAYAICGLMLEKGIAPA